VNRKMMAWLFAGAIFMTMGALGLAVVTVDTAAPIVSSSVPTHLGNYTSISEVWIGLVDVGPDNSTGSGVAFVTYTDHNNEGIGLSLISGNATSGIWQATLPNPHSHGKRGFTFTFSDSSTPANTAGHGGTFNVTPVSDGDGEDTEEPDDPPDEPPDIRETVAKQYAGISPANIYAKFGNYLPYAMLTLGVGTVVIAYRMKD